MAKAGLAKGERVSEKNAENFKKFLRF